MCPPKASRKGQEGIKLWADRRCGAVAIEEELNDTLKALIKIPSWRDTGPGLLGREAGRVVPPTPQAPSGARLGWNHDQPSPGALALAIFSCPTGANLIIKAWNVENKTLKLVL